MSAKNSTKSNEILITRVYDAQVKAVWDAWTDLKQVVQWWGPRGFTLTSHSKDLRAGGIWHYTMHGPDGTDFPNKTKYLEVDQYKRLVYDHGGYDDRPPLFRVTVTFTDVKGKTRMEMRMGFATPEVATEMEKFIRKANGYSTWDRLAEYLTKESSGKELFVINRSFNASIGRVFEMWSDPLHVGKWMGPAGSIIKYLKADIRSGGSACYVMSMGPTTMYGRCDYLEVTKPNRIVYQQQFCDEHEKVTRHPMAPTWPETMLTTVAFEAEGEDRTRISLTWEVAGKATAEEMDAFIKARAGMMGGWTGSFDKLEEVLR